MIVTELPPGEHRLTPEVAANLTAVPGLYAAWIMSDTALADAGIRSAPPYLVYVGIAVGQGGLRHRLRRHAATPWWELIDLLAARRNVLPAWWAHAPKNTRHKSLAIPALAKVAHDQGLAWQHDHLRWGWTTGPKADMQAMEIATIETRRPLLNRKGRGLRSAPPPRLRAPGYERERAWWLFHAAWLAALTLQPPTFVHRSLMSIHVSIDADGWPVPLGQGETRKLRIPSERHAARVLTKAAPAELRSVVANHTSSHQARAWWTAYVGQQFLPDGVPVDDAIASAMRRQADGYGAPARLPPPALREQLIALVAQLPYVGH